MKTQFRISSYKFKQFFQLVQLLHKKFLIFFLCPWSWNSLSAMSERKGQVFALLIKQQERMEKKSFRQIASPLLHPPFFSCCSSSYLPWGWLFHFSRATRTKKTREASREHEWMMGNDGISIVYMLSSLNLEGRSIASGEDAEHEDGRSTKGHESTLRGIKDRKTSPCHWIARVSRDNNLDCVTGNFSLFSRSTLERFSL